MESRKGDVSVVLCLEPLGRWFVALPVWFEVCFDDIRHLDFGDLALPLDPVQNADHILSGFNLFRQQRSISGHTRWGKENKPSVGRCPWK